MVRWHALGLDAAAMDCVLAIQKPAGVVHLRNISVEHGRADFGIDIAESLAREQAWLMGLSC